MTMIYVKEFYDLTTKELYSLMRLRSEVFVVEQNCVYQDLDGKDIESYHVYMELDGDITSYLRIVPDSISDMEGYSIGRVVVSKENRGKGYSKKLLNAAIKFIYHEMKQSSITISAQLYLLEFYKSLGFTDLGESYLEDGIPHIKMVHKKNKEGKIK